MSPVSAALTAFRRGLTVAVPVCVCRLLVPLAAAVTLVELLVSLGVLPALDARVWPLALLLLLGLPGRLLVMCALQLSVVL